ncbi:hypothetical protein EDD29_8101 [Actinocorallia herbida]|uniref:Uncharacterized protein n=1 Tax=Actinocorallia herbida TaxID=58109 RepID=A0A3N1DA27_9ACTN|nr:hypothetical protein EDD29_8101 [Actinocorallia herbida]
MRRRSAEDAAVGVALRDGARRMGPSGAALRGAGVTAVGVLSGGRPGVHGGPGAGGGERDRRRGLGGLLGGLGLLPDARRRRARRPRGRRRAPAARRPAPCRPQGRGGRRVPRRRGGPLPHAARSGPRTRTFRARRSAFLGGRHRPRGPRRHQRALCRPQTRRRGVDRGRPGDLPAPRGPRRPHRRRPADQQGRGRPAHRTPRPAPPPRPPPDLRPLPRRLDPDRRHPHEGAHDPRPRPLHDPARTGPPPHGHPPRRPVRRRHLVEIPHPPPTIPLHPRLPLHHRLDRRPPRPHPRQSQPPNPEIPPNPPRIPPTHFPDPFRT